MLCLRSPQLLEMSPTLVCFPKPLVRRNLSRICMFSKPSIFFSLINFFRKSQEF